MEKPEPQEKLDPMAERVLALQLAIGQAAAAQTLARDLTLAGAKAEVTEAAVRMAFVLLEQVRAAARHFDAISEGPATGLGYGLN